jgi:DeoR-like helix-turn-helix domain
MRQNGNGSGKIRQNDRKSGKVDPAIKKAYEIGYAVFRMGAALSNAPFAESLERQALKLLNAAISGNGGDVLNTASALHYLIGFGEGVGLVHPGNAQTMRDELGELNALAAMPESAENEEVFLGDIFAEKQEPLFSVSTSGNPAIGIRQSGNMESGNPAKDNPAKEPAIRQNEPPEDLPELKYGNNESGTRQSAILEKIRQSGNCRLKDLTEILPDISERTLRYDLQSLVEQNLVERVGAGGPAVFYRAR